MQIGIIGGAGVVGSAVRNGFEVIGHTVRVHDVRLPDTSMRDVLDTELVFLCVPTPCSEDGTCDTAIVESVLHELEAAGYAGLTVIKSTIIPGTTDRFREQYKKLRLAFCPEFLRERSAVADFTEHHDVCIIGAYDDEAFDLVKQAHGRLPKNVFRMKPVEAEFAKYFSNVYNAMRIIFANGFYEACQSVGADYSVIKNAMVHRENITDHYLTCNDNFRGFGGVCLPKDTMAFAAFVRSMNLDLKLFDVIVEENRRFKRTVPDGMREI